MREGVRLGLQQLLGSEQLDRQVPSRIGLRLGFLYKPTPFTRKLASGSILSLNLPP